MFNVAGVVSAHKVLAEDIMLRNIYQLSMKSTYGDAEKALMHYSFKVFPIVIDEGQIIKTASCSRNKLVVKSYSFHHPRI